MALSGSSEGPWGIGRTARVLQESWWVLLLVLLRLKKQCSICFLCVHISKREMLCWNLLSRWRLWPWLAAEPPFCILPHSRALLGPCPCQFLCIPLFFPVTFVCSLPWPLEGTLPHQPRLWNKLELSLPFAVLGFLLLSLFHQTFHFSLCFLSDLDYDVYGIMK